MIEIIHLLLRVMTKTKSLNTIKQVQNTCYCLKNTPENKWIPVIAGCHGKNRKVVPIGTTIRIQIDVHLLRCNLRLHRCNCNFKLPLYHYDNQVEF